MGRGRTKASLNWNLRTLDTASKVQHTLNTVNLSVWLYKVTIGRKTALRHRGLLNRPKTHGVLRGFPNMLSVAVGITVSKCKFDAQ